MEDQQKTFDVRVSMEVKLTQQDVDDIVCTALEGGITYWADKAVVVGEYLGEYASEQISRGGKLRIRTMEPFDKNNTRWYELDIEKFLQGFRLWVENGYDECNAVSGGQVDCCEIDGCTADCVIQLALFGEVVYA